jgi:hypothetical protein
MRRVHSFLSLLIAVLWHGTACATQTIVPLNTAERQQIEAVLSGSRSYTAPIPIGSASLVLVVPDALTNADSRNPTLGWTRLMIDLFIKHKTSPNRAARSLAIVHVAMHDAWIVADEQCARSQAACLSDARIHSVNAAAARTLRYLFVSEESSFDRYVHALATTQTQILNRALPIADVVAQETRWLALGQVIGDAAVRYAQADGADKGWNGSNLEFYGEGRIYGPGSWEPTAPYFYYPPEEPFALYWRAWVLKKPSQHRPKPPAFASDRYAKDLLELIELYRTGLTEEQMRIARYWADGRGSMTPPGRWNEIALKQVSSSKLSARETIALFAHLNIALADAFIAAWDAKYAYWTMRPVTAARKIFGFELKPLILTPPFPSYVSGHATFSAAAATVLSYHLPNKLDELNAMAEEAALSRLYGGIHFRFDNDDGLALGRRVGKQVIERFDAPTKR